MNWSDAPFTKQTLTSASHDPKFASKQQHNSTPDPRETCREEPILVPTLLKKGSQGERHETETSSTCSCGVMLTSDDDFGAWGVAEDSICNEALFDLSKFMSVSGMGAAC